MRAYYDSENRTGGPGSFTPPGTKPGKIFTVPRGYLIRHSKEAATLLELQLNN